MKFSYRKYHQLCSDAKTGRLFSDWRHSWRLRIRAPPTQCLHGWNHCCICRVWPNSRYLIQHLLLWSTQEFGDNAFPNTCTSNYTSYASIQQWHIHFCNCYIYPVELTVFQYLGFSVPPVYLTAGPGTEGYLPWFGRDRCLKAKMLQNVILFNVPLMCCDVLLESKEAADVLYRYTTVNNSIKEKVLFVAL